MFEVTDTDVADLAEALRSGGFVDPDDDTVPTWPAGRDTPLWVSPETLARFVLDWVASNEITKKAARPYFGRIGCYCEHCVALTGDCLRCGAAMRAKGSELCAGCDAALDAEFGAKAVA